MATYIHTYYMNISRFLLQFFGELLYLSIQKVAAVMNEMLYFFFVGREYGLLLKTQIEAIRHEPTVGTT